MSYSGFREFICENGHYQREGCWEDDPSECFFCKAKIAFSNSVDQTNGQNADEPWSMPGAKDQVGFDDNWFEDHYGNRYAKQIPRYAPKGDQWRPARAALGE